MHLQQDIKKQRATGKTRDGTFFPLSIIIRPAEEVESDANIPQNGM